MNNVMLLITVIELLLVSNKTYLIYETISDMPVSESLFVFRDSSDFFRTESHSFSVNELPLVTHLSCYQVNSLKYQIRYAHNILMYVCFHFSCDFAHNMEVSADVKCSTVLSWSQPISI